MADYTGSNTPKENRDRWQTPPAIFAYFNNIYNFKIDIAASRENTFCKQFYSEDNSALEQDWDAQPGDYVWCNPPYSNIGPWIKAISQQNKRGIGAVMLIPADQSVGWFKEAIRTASLNEIIIGGRLAFLSAATGKPVPGNNKGSQILIWQPFNDVPIITKYIERDFILST